jgi:outer membrane immunogenic protein
LIRRAIALLILAACSAVNAPVIANEPGSWPEAGVLLPAPAPIWQGLYVGVTGGALDSIGSITTFNPDRSRTTQSQTNIAGIHAGYNWQSGTMVFGVEGDWSHDLDGIGIGFATLRARAGWAVGNTLIYGTVGEGTVNSYLSRFNGRQKVDHQHYGIVAGGGLETMLPNNFSVRAEALFFDAGNERYDFPAFGGGSAISADSSFSDYIYRAGLSYHFNGGPVVASEGNDPAPRPTVSWQGPYLGITGGNIDEKSQLKLPATQQIFYNQYQRDAVSVFAGYNWQSGGGVLGVEGDWSRIDHVTGVDLFTVRGRAGWALGNTLIYATAGMGSQNAYVHRVTSGSRQRIEQQFFGIVAGGGIETMLPYNLSLRAEALYFGAGQEHFDFPASGNAGAIASTLDLDKYIYRAGLSYHFN